MICPSCYLHRDYHIWNVLSDKNNKLYVIDLELKQGDYRFDVGWTYSKGYGISTRMLRYYEQIGLIESQRKEDYSYRVYDEMNLRRLQQIIILRKLQIPVKQICTILASPDTAEAIDIFKKSITELDGEITALSTIKAILKKLVTELEKIAIISLRLDFLGEDSVLKMVGSLP